MASLENPIISHRGATISSMHAEIVTPVARTLTSPQLHDLFDILTHYETYDEVQLFRDPDTIAGYGYPFALQYNPDNTPSYAPKSTVPLLAGVLRSIVLPLPGVRDLPSDFWHVRFQGILSKLGEAELSESYDKGVLGVRKTLATAASAIHESVSRAVLGGVPKGPQRDLFGEYDKSKASDLSRAWDDVVHELTYGTLIDDLFEAATASSNLDDLPPAVLATVDYVIIHVATFMHHVLVLSSEGPYMLRLIEMVHKLIPYSAIRQVLRIGNVATMLNGLTKLLLAKMSMGSISNWIGLTRNADDGMNLLQWIISGVLSADGAEFRKTADSIEKAKDGPPKELLAKIKEYMAKSRSFHDQTRARSFESPTSIISAILHGGADSLTTEQHAQCLEYLSACLAVRDREEITKVLCRHKPDHFTQAIRDVVNSFEPIIRSVHERIDLREHVSSVENILTDFIDTSKPKSKPVPISNVQTSNLKAEDSPTETRAPSIEDYVGLLERARQLVYNLIHDMLNKCPEVAVQYRSYCKQVFKTVSSGQTSVPPQAESSSTSSFESAVEEVQSGGATNNDQSEGTHDVNPMPTEDTPSITGWRKRRGGAGALSSNLQALFSALPSETRARVLTVVDAHAIYLAQLEELSLDRMQHILDDMQPPQSQPERSSNGNTDSGSNTLANSSLQVPEPSRGSRPGSSRSTTAVGLELAKAANSGIFSSPVITASISGPGMFLSRWQQLLDETVVTPAVPGGQPRRGKDVKHALAQGKTVSSATKDAWDPEALTALVESGVPVPPEEERIVVEALGGPFKELVADLVARMEV
ncbi:PX-associated-domain-containing protein [Rhypophila decipiens]|uniref:PX-associated-domain-containing protein n=1 Tax=Rhypophila decipiens TaxID=261697 RepID=A0AAN6Y9A6_9PEZI|nr:PX-associated-domain-containing protein [Rhypophila decipiens]